MAAPVNRTINRQAGSLLAAFNIIDRHSAILSQFGAPFQHLYGQLRAQAQYAPRIITGHPAGHGNAMRTAITQHNLATGPGSASYDGINQPAQ